MIEYCFVDEFGCVEKKGRAFVLPDGAMLLDELVDPMIMMYVDDVWIERPSLNEPMIDDGSFIIEDCPDGLAAIVTDFDTGAYFGRVECEDGSLIISLPDPGQYTIELIIPRPFTGNATYNVVSAGVE